MSIRKWLKGNFRKLSHKEKSIIFNDVEIGPNDLHVHFALDGSYEVESWDKFKERGKATSAVVEAEWSCRELQELAEGVKKKRMEISRAKESLNMMRLNARTARDHVSVQLGQGTSVWFD